MIVRLEQELFVEKQKGFLDNSVFGAVERVEEWIETSKPEAIFVSSGSIKEASFDWLPTELTDPDIRGNRQWGLVRGHAAVELKRRFPDAQLVTLSRSTNEPPGISDAQVMANTVRRKLHSDQVDVLVDDFPRDTFTELMEVTYMSLSRGYREIAYMSTIAQEPRAQAMLDSIFYLNDIDERRKVDQMMEFNQVKRGWPAEMNEHFDRVYDFLVDNSSRLPDIKVEVVPSEAVLSLINEKYRQRVLEPLSRDEGYLEQVRKDIGAAEQWRRGDYGKLS